MHTDDIILLRMGFFSRSTLQCCKMVGFAILVAQLENVLIFSHGSTVTSHDYDNCKTCYNVHSKPHMYHISQFL